MDYEIHHLFLAPVGSLPCVSMGAGPGMAAAGTGLSESELGSEWWQQVAGARSGGAQCLRGWPELPGNLVGKLQDPGGSIQGQVSAVVRHSAWGQAHAGRALSSATLESRVSSRLAQSGQVWAPGTPIRQWRNWVCHRAPAASCCTTWLGSRQESGSLLAWLTGHNLSPHHHLHECLSVVIYSSVG